MKRTPLGFRRRLRTDDAPADHSSGPPRYFDSFAHTSVHYPDSVGKNPCSTLVVSPEFDIRFIYMHAIYVFSRWPSCGFTLFLPKSTWARVFFLLFAFLLFFLFSFLSDMLLPIVFLVLRSLSTWRKRRFSRRYVFISESETRMVMALFREKRWSCPSSGSSSFQSFSRVRIKQSGESVRSKRG